MNEFIIKPSPANPLLSKRVAGVDHSQAVCELSVPMERALGLYLNDREIVTMMTIGDYAEYLAVGFLLNQNMLTADDEITGIDVDHEVDVVVVRTRQRTDFESKLKKKTMTSGCAQGTVFGDIMEKFDHIVLPDDAVMRTSWLYALSRKINTTDSLYLEAGAVHGCVLCQRDRPLVYMEDVGRHNAVDKIAGYMFVNDMPAPDKIMYTTGRLTSEMVIKCVQMQIPILMSRSGFTASGVELAKRAGLTLIGRAKGKRFICVSGEHRLVFDADPSNIPAESVKIQRKASLRD
ncbi:MAG: formate dehydrogenase accessory sulfurtransferase FdhD [Sphingomonadales bacterium]